MAKYFTKRMKLFKIFMKLALFTAIYHIVKKQLVIENWLKHPFDGITNHGSVRQQLDPALVIFTTFKDSSPHHMLAHRLVISNWASFGRIVKPVLFANMSEKNGTHKSSLESLIEEALQEGWDVLPLPSTNKYGTPHLKPMYAEIFKRYDASFYGYANGDLLFTDGLATTLRYIESILSPALSNNVLMVGRRTDILFYSNSCSTLENESNGSTKSARIQSSPLLTSKHPVNCKSHFNKSNLDKLTKNGTLKEAYYIDYFFMTRDNSSFNWSAIADVVIGRLEYDQYLVAKAIDFGMNTIDLTRTVLTAHLSKPGHPNTGFSHIDSYYNIQIIGNYHHYNGMINKTSLYSNYSATTHEIFLTLRCNTT